MSAAFGICPCDESAPPHGYFVRGKHLLYIEPVYSIEAGYAQAMLFCSAGLLSEAEKRDVEAMLDASPLPDYVADIEMFGVRWSQNWAHSMIVGCIEPIVMN